MVGKELGNYRVVSLLGEGGMGAVFAGEHRFLGSRVAIKVLHGTFANNPAVTQRFFQEAKSSLEIGHANIIKILDFGQSNEGELYLVMELLEGRSLTGAIADNGTFGEGATARIGTAICEGLIAAHAKGVVHRDLKPDNIFITATGDVKVLDFGIAKVATSASGTKTGSLLGTPQYMAPEQAKGSKHVGPHTDIYALGAILFEMMTGQAPFSGEEVAELLAKQLFEEPPPPSTLCPISPEMEALILQCLKKKPEERPATMVELRDRLAARIGASSSSGARPIGKSHTPAPQPSQPGVKTTLGGSASQVMDSAAPKKSSGLLVAAALGAIALIAGLGFVLTRKPTPPPDKPIAVVTPPAPKPEPVVAPPPQKPETARVVLRSDPPGAQVTLDGKPAGTTPALLNVTLPQEVSLTLGGYKPAREILTTAGELTIKLTADKKPVTHTARPPKPAKPAAAPTKPRGEGLD